MIAKTVEVIRILFGVVFILFLPGLAWSVLLFKRGEIDLIKRVALSFGLSIAIVPLTVLRSSKPLTFGAWLCYIVVHECRD